MKRTITLLLLALLAVACTQEKPYKAIAKVDVNSQSKFDESQDHIMLISNVGASKHAPVISYEMGQGELVRYKFTEESLLVYKVPRDQRFQENPNNLTPLVTIPVEHVDYKCQEDHYGDCQNTEVENTDITWDEKQFFKAKFQDTKVTTLMTLGVELENWIIDCHQEMDSHIVSTKIEEGALNFVVEKTFRTRPYCLSALEELTDVTFTVKQHYSIVSLDQLKTPNYQAVQYTTDGKNEFGFFKTEFNVLDEDHRSTMDGDVQYINRWADKTVDYYLGPNFLKPENKSLKQATVHAVNVINHSLEKAGALTRIKLHEPDQTMMTGDLRKNMIVMVEDPIQMGLLGYGPSVTNPHTGEIIHARTVMYPGILKLTLKSAYEDIIEHKLSSVPKEENKQPETPEKAPETPPTETAKNIKTLSGLSEISQLFNQRQTDEALRRSHNDLKEEDQRLARNIEREYTDHDVQKQLRFLDELSKNNFYPSEMFNFNSLIEAELDQVLKISQAKPWTELSESQKTQLMDILMPYAWIPTLVHELGHNLGMRHNFSGSNDQPNFYTSDELESMGVTRPVQYSSIMDYGYRTINELPVMGKYDIAALRFAYARNVEMADGTIANYPVENTLAIKDYQFCTDEHVYLNATCNRFDEGTNLTEIVDFTIDSYKQEYTRRNLRGDRRDFSSYGGTLSYMSRIKSKFHTLRLAFEQYENYKYRFGLDDNATEWEDIPFLKEVKLATEKSGRFLIDLIKTPTETCLVQQDQSGQMILAPLTQLTTFDPYARNCFEAQIAEGFTMIGQTGLSFDDKKYITNPYSYVDQIDVRGIWVDKLLAVETLFDRTLGITNFDTYTENYLSLASLRPELNDLLTGVLTNEVSNNLNFKTNPKLADVFPPEVQFENVSYDLISDQAHKLEVALHPMVQRYFGLRSNSYFQVELVESVIQSLNQAPLGYDLYQDIINAITVHEYIATDQKQAPTPYVTISGQTYMANDSNTVAQSLISKLRQHNLAVEMKDENKMLPTEHVSLYQNILKRLNYIQN
ncbi:MAG: zinc-dependent metalloprotease [Bdellovibrionales bacterium]|nr:zinc-dependent metalloprotease [Bdellovibrionales bacterium]